MVAVSASRERRFLGHYLAIDEVIVWYHCAQLRSQGADSSTLIIWRLEQGSAIGVTTK